MAVAAWALDRSGGMVIGQLRGNLVETSEMSGCLSIARICFDHFVETGFGCRILVQLQLQEPEFVVEFDVSSIEFDRLAKELTSIPMEAECNAESSGAGGDG